MAASSPDMENQIETSNRSSRDASNIDAGEKPSDSPDFGPAPDGGVTAWLVAAGGCTVFFCCLGFTNAFGAFEEYYLTHQLSDKTPDDVAWIGSLAAFLQFATGMIAGPIFDRFGVNAFRPAALAYVFAMMMLGLCKTYWQIMLVQGVLMGIAMGFLQIPIFATIPHWFDKNRAAAFGIVVAGSSLGGIVMPIAISKMLNGTSLGFGWTVRIVGFMILPLLAFSCVVVKTRIPLRTSKVSIPFAQVLGNKTYLLLVASMFFLFMGVFTPLFYIPTFATTLGIEATLAGYTLAILNAASFFGRVIPGVFADRMGRTNAFALGGIATGIIIFCMNLPTNTAGLIVYAVIIGFWSGTVVSGATAALTVCIADPQQIGAYLGIGLFIAGFGSLIGPPINGVLVDKYGGFFEVSMFSGAITLFGGLIVLVAKATMPQGLLSKA
ncbi:hypothetical protein PFICI_02651 [Pestalotiopsis fici W106-1]|uniref:Major facilitator superfamily (MFS) profile domain-containing protein n=1 Tax=Pestalotiopsis fici (strain W106-1 / CGMCC3.15140) TaxID=1229662 RepID=W3XHC3_PESFW|nr:uncharacterized protein PFICI_02651 [Pestalotiopsis fici W106-1]ETS84626.1 hypothetical protein PFICI_02651 [Pestalotiopsis fici W106-1]